MLDVESGVRFWAVKREVRLPGIREMLKRVREEEESENEASSSWSSSGDEEEGGGKRMKMAA